MSDDTHVSFFSFLTCLFLSYTLTWRRCTVGRPNRYHPTRTIRQYKLLHQAKWVYRKYILNQPTPANQLISRLFRHLLCQHSRLLLHLLGSPSNPLLIIYLQPFHNPPPMFFGLFLQTP